jgi:hypothetical protein
VVLVTLSPVSLPLGTTRRNPRRPLRTTQMKGLLTMNHQPSQGIELRLSPFEGKHLSEFLERAAGETHGEFHRNTLEAARDKLDDARVLALWLRENVLLEFQPSEAAEVLAALAANLATEDLPSEARASLAGVRDKLAACLPRDLAVRI